MSLTFSPSLKHSPPVNGGDGKHRVGHLADVSCSISYVWCLQGGIGGGRETEKRGASTAAKVVDSKMVDG